MKTKTTARKHGEYQLVKKPAKHERHIFNEEAHWPLDETKYASAVKTVSVDMINADMQ